MNEEIWRDVFKYVFSLKGLRDFIYTLITIVLIVIGTIWLGIQFDAKAQNVIIQGNTISLVQQQDKETPYNYQDKQGKTYKIYMTPKYKFYIKRVSKKTGKEYKYFLPKEIQEALLKTINNK